MAFLNPCAMCSSPCCKDYAVTVTAFDVLRISGRAKLKPEEFSGFMECNLFNADEETILDFSDGYPCGYVLAIKSHPCYFLDSKNRCMIHEYSPLSCRRYPFNIAGQMKARYCPFHAKLLFRLRGPEVRLEDYMREITAYRAMVREWNKEPGKQADCMGFLMDKCRSFGDL